jgi:hypothetical protein
MAIFAVLTDKPCPALGEKIAELYPRDFYKLSDAQWLLRADIIARSLAEQLDIRSGKYGRAIVIRTTGSASGWHSKTVWEWLTQKASDLDG